MLLLLSQIVFVNVILISACLIAFRLVVKSSCRWNRCYTCLIGKTAIVTGANSGIGFFTALDLAKRGARVILACRSKERATVARDSIVQQTGNANVEFRIVDYCSLESIRRFADDINRNIDRVDILVNNAGSAGASNYETADGLKLTWQINHFAPFLLTNLLLDKIKQTPSSRIVVVASVAAKFSNLQIEDLNRYPKSRFSVLAKNTLYAWTKQANILFGRELSRRLSNTNTKVYILHPGSIASNIWRRIPTKVLFWYKIFMKFVYRTSEEGAQTSIFCAVAKECAQQTGEYYVDCKPVSMYSNCNDMNFASEFWRKSEAFVSLTD